MLRRGCLYYVLVCVCVCVCLNSCACVPCWCCLLIIHHDRNCFLVFPFFSFGIFFFILIYALPICSLCHHGGPLVFSRVVAAVAAVLLFIYLILVLTLRHSAALIWLQTHVPQAPIWTETQTRTRHRAQHCRCSCLIIYCFFFFFCIFLFWPF